ncbi:MAG: DUF4139 domain-containing protein [Planctomycetales bacterium]|nr:DUF4139 domain-containing protein [Planctomycetales bacterium]
MRRLFLTTLALPMLLATASTPILAADAKANELDPKTERVIIFKDGYCLFIKKATFTTDKNGEAFTDDVPDAAVLGSFWAVPEEGRLVSMQAGWKTTEETKDKETICKETIEILLANKGKQAKIELHDKTIFSGVIREVLVDKTPTVLEQPQLDALDIRSLSSSAVTTSVRRRPIRPEMTESHTLTTITGANFVLRTDDGDVFLNAGTIRSISIKDMKTTLAKTMKTTRRAKRLIFKFPEGEKKQALSVMYFRPGIRWIPTYRVDLQKKEGKNIAQVSLQAEILNEAEDLHDVPVDIVVGVPNFRFKGTPSPLVLEATLRNALAETEPVIMGQAMANNSFSNAMYSQRSGEFRRTAAQANAAAEGGIVNLPGELTAAGAQDLFVYKLPKINLDKGDRSAVSIFTTEAPYRDIYTWDVHVSRQDVEAAPSGAGIASPLTLSKNEVWHQVVITNNTNLPWTTGAAMITEGQQPLAQELLTYTPPKDECRIPVTVSIDTRGAFNEKEVGRELKALHWSGYDYARIEKEANVHLCNNKKVDIEAEITLRVGGKVTKADAEGVVVLSAFRPEDWQNYQGHPAVNNSSIVTWKVKLKPGETIEPKVTYHYFTRQ